MTDLAVTISTIRQAHRRRRYILKQQQGVDRRLESYIRLNETDWSPDLPEAERKRINKEVMKVIDDARAGGGDPEIIRMVEATDKIRELVADRMRARYETVMEKSADQLPAFSWIKNDVHGVAALGFTTIIAEAGALDRYPNPAKLWKRLGFAPYDGLAGSTWRRETWRPRTLTKEEWIANPFSPSRYALMHQIAIWLVNAQWTGAAKTESGEGEPKGPYGEIYAARRKHTLVTHPEWTPGHRRNDALRVTFKRFLVHLWEHWRDDLRSGRFEHAAQQAGSIGEAGQSIADAHPNDASLAASPPGHHTHDAHPKSARKQRARRTNAILKPSTRMSAASRSKKLRNGVSHAQPRT